MAKSGRKVQAFCSEFCVCTDASVDDIQTKKLLDFIWKKVKIPQMPNEWAKYTRPKATYHTRFDNFSVTIHLTLMYSKDEIKKIVDQILNLKGLSEDSVKTLKKFKEEIPLQVAKAGSYADSNHARLQFSASALSYFKDASLTMEIIGRIPKENTEISKIIDVAGDTFKMPAELTTCSTFRFDSSKSKLVGGLILPTQLPLSLQVGSKIGNAQLHGLTIDLIDSKIGLEAIEVNQEKEYLEIGTRGTFQLNEFDRFLAKPFELSSEYSNLLVEGI